MLLVCACLAGWRLSARALPRLLNEHMLLQAPAQSTPQKNQTPPSHKGGNRGGQPPSRKTGDWLESHKNLPLDQQEKALESDPNFQKLPPDRQAALKERLRKFNSLPPEQRERSLQRLDFWSSLTHEQRDQIRDANQKLQALPQDRRVAVHTALRQLRQMDLARRQQVFESDRFHSSFSPQEQEILKQLSGISPPFGASSTFKPKTTASPAPTNGNQPK